MSVLFFGKSSGRDEHFLRDFIASLTGKDRAGVSKSHTKHWDSLIKSLGELYAVLSSFFCYPAPNLSRNLHAGSVIEQQMTHDMKVEMIKNTNSKQLRSCELGRKSLLHSSRRYAREPEDGKRVGKMFVDTSMSLAAVASDIIEECSRGDNEGNGMRKILKLHLDGDPSERPEFEKLKRFQISLPGNVKYSSAGIPLPYNGQTTTIPVKGFNIPFREILAFYNNEFPEEMSLLNQHSMVWSTFLSLFVFF